MKFKANSRRRALEYEKDVLKFWKGNKIFEKSIEQRPESQAYVFYDGPPFITGVPHHGTLLSSIVKDALPRYQTMQGKRVERRWGWDCHGLPAENFTEKKLGITDRHEIGTTIPLEDYIVSCRDNMVQTGGLWEDTIDRIGRWVDFKGAYKTMDKEFMESVWWAFKTLYEKGKIYEGEKVLMYDTKWATPLSKAEVTMDAGAYQDVTDPSVYVKFKIVDGKDFLKNNHFGFRDLANYNVVILHGYTGRNDKNFIPWLKTELEKRGAKVQAPQLPNTDDPVVMDQVEFVLNNVKFDENTILVGHSLGGLVAMKVLEKLPKPIHKLVLVAPATLKQFYAPGEDINPKTGKQKAFIKSFDYKFDYGKISQQAKSKVILQDDNDTPSRVPSMQLIAEKIGADLYNTIANKVHFTAQQEPFILDKILDSEVTIRAISLNDGEREREYLLTVPADENGFTCPAKPEELTDSDAFKGFLQRRFDEHLGKNIAAGRVPATLYWIEKSGEIVGVARLRHYLNDKLRERCGHIGIGGIGKKYRGQGIGTKALKLLLEEAWKLGEKRVLLTIHGNNIASRRMAENAGGVLEKEVERPEQPGSNRAFYWFCPQNHSPEVGPERYLLAWTTTPWTLPANVCLAVHPDLDYAEVEHNGEILIMAKSLVEKVMTDEKHQPLDYKIVGELKGKDLVGLKYEPLFNSQYGDNRIINQIKQLNLPDGEYVVFGGALLEAHGLRKANDIDIFATKKLYNQLAKTDGWAVKIFPNGDEELVYQDGELKAEVFNESTYLPNCNEGAIKKKIESAEKIGGVSFLALETEIEERKSLARTKDAADVKLLQGLVNSHQVYAADYVSDVDGTGIVHTAPAYGEDDFSLAQKYDLPVVHKLDDYGKFIDGEWQGQDLWEANKQIAKKVLADGKALKIDYVRHEYPHNPRTGNRLIYRAHPSWFMDIEGQRAEMLENNQPINWFPEHIKSGRFAKTIEMAPDWNLSRDRFWASAMPVWEGVDKDGNKKQIVVGSYAELKELSGVELEDYHRPWVDEIEFEKDGVHYKRIDKVLDCWFESGSMPFAQFHYPFENKEKFEAGFPGDFIVEYVGQVRAWFYYVHAVSTALFGKHAFKNVIVTGTVAGNDGRKMSKSYGNYTDPNELMDKFSADSLRFLLLQSPLLNGEDFALIDKDVADVARKLSMIWNMYDFFTMYAEVDGWEFDPEKPLPKLSELTNPLDIWIVSRLHELNEQVVENMDKYNLPDALEPILPFIDDASNWYVRRSRRRFWKSEDDGDKNDAYKTLHYVLLKLSVILAPFTPFLSEELYQKLGGGAESVHLLDYPMNFEKNQAVLDEMAIVRFVINEGLRQRAENGFKVRQPLQGAIVRCTKQAVSDYADVIKEELNLKDVMFEIVKAKEGEEFVPKIYVATLITDDLKREGLAREVVRAVQGARKKAGLNVDDRINLVLTSDDENLKQAMTQFKDEIHHETLTVSEKVAEAIYDETVQVDKIDLKIKLEKA